MNWGSRNILALSLGERTIQCAQVAAGGSTSVVERLAVYELPAGVTYEQPDVLGRSLKTFLHEHRMTVARAVIGVPLRWLVTHTTDMPPADAVTARAMLRLTAERLSSGDELEMVYDCVGEPGGDSASQVMLVGLMRTQLERIIKLAEAAGLAMVGVTPTSLALGAALTGEGTVSTLLLAEHGTEWVTRRADAAPTVRHLRAAPGESGADAAMWEGELRRVQTLAGHAAAPRGALVMVDAIGMDDAGRSRVQRIVGDDRFRPAHVKELGAQVRGDAVSGAAGPRGADVFIPAIALALATAGRSPLAVNFIEPRLAAPPVRRFGRTQVIAAVVCVLVLVGLAALYITMRDREKQLVALDAQVKNQQKSYEADVASIARFNYGRQYFETRTPVLDCLKQITQTFHDNESIWVTSFTLKDTGKGVLQGKASDQRVILAVMDRLRANEQFSDVQLQYMGDSTGRDRDSMFSIKLTYHGGKSGS